MSNWVKITKAKQLRYKLISVMYLIFIALSIINIPIEWLHVNKYVAPLLTETTIVSIENEDLREVYTTVEATKSSFFEALGYDEATKTYREPFGYTVTDAFFLSQGNGKDLQTALQRIEGLSSAQDERFKRLFAEDINNGLMDDDEHWVKWKFKHVPASMAETLLNEIILRIRLISGNLDVAGTGKGRTKQSMVEYATNLDYLVFGDTLKVKSSLEGIEALVSRGGDTTSLPKMEDTYFFLPTSTGTHHLTLRSRSVEEQYTFMVLPAQLPNRSKTTFITYFEGAPSTLELGTVVSNGRVECGCDENATFMSSKLSFTPDTSGWCSFQVLGANGITLLDDSIYIQPTPKPYFKVKGLLQGGKLPSGDREVALEAFHPSVPADYEISSIVYEKLGAGEGDLVANASSFELADFTGAVWIKKVIANAGDQTFESDQTFLITIEP